MYHSVETELSAMKMNDLVLLLVSVPVLIHGEVSPFTTLIFE